MNNASQKDLPQNWKARFFTLWTGQAFSLLGSQLVQFALVWWLTKTTGSATVLATASLVGFLPQIFLGPIVGAMVDRWSRRMIIFLSDFAVALATVVLVVLFWSGAIEVWHVYMVMFVRAVGGGFHWPAMAASTSLMVPKEHFSRIQGLNQMLHGAMNIGSAPLGALLLSLLPMHGVLAVDLVTAALALLALLIVPIPQPSRTTTAEDGEGSTLWQDLRSGFRYVSAWPGLVMLMCAATLINLLLTPASALSPLLVTEHFKGDALHLASIESGWGIGVVVGGLLLSVWGGFRRRIYTSLMGLIILGAAMTIIGFTPATAFPLAVAMMFLTGIGNPITNGPLFAVVQAAVAPDMQGRVFTLMTSLATAMTPIGLLAAGPLADAFGVQVWFIVGGVLTALMGIAAFFVRPIVEIEDHRQREITVEANPGDQVPAAAAGPGD